MATRLLVGRTVGDLPDVAPLGHDADRGVLLSRRARVRDPQPDWHLRRHELGVLALPSGQVLACDPGLEDFDVRPFTRRVRPGRYPVVVTYLGDQPEPGPGDRVAAAAILFRDEPPARWELALTDGQKLTDLGHGEIFGYGVDGGTGCFVDPEVAAAFAAGKRNFSRMLRAFQKGEYRPLLHTFDDEPAIAVFESGWGDGFYASYWGLDARDEPVCLVTDFSVLTVPVTATARFGEAEPLAPGRLDHPALARAGLEVDLTSVAPQGLTLELRGAVQGHHEVRLLARQGDAWVPAPASASVTIDRHSATRHIHPDPPVDRPALELELMIGARLLTAVEAPVSKTPVVRRRRAQ